ncbi:CoA-binding protein [Rugosimonospora africana]|uniref:CoA-binding protein n=2 Tax=Rugosimonospora africana TaxID=556532 RepID=A0A8J3R0V3_9ACTN|nr:CoA-binding protein [Rugosimonospora africana]
MSGMTIDAARATPAAGSPAPAPDPTGGDPAGSDPTRPTARDGFDRLFDPRSIAVVGASADPAKRGHQAIRALLAAGYPYPVYPVNPHADSILGLPVSGSVAGIGHPVDVALVATPARLVPDVVAECAAAGVAGAVVLASGFRESGAAGAELEARLRAVIDRTGIHVVGPNTSGMLNVGTGANLVGLPDVPAGPISVIAQSGNMLLSLAADNRELGGPGFDICVGLGNQAGVRYDECVSYLARREQTGAIAVHCEGLRDGRAFLVAVAEASRHRPVVLLRGGRSEIGQRAALSHTGSIAGSDRVATAVLRQAGVELVDRSDELAVVAGALATLPPMAAGTRVAVLSDGGGHAALAADALTMAGVEFAELSGDTLRRLRTVLGEGAALANPVDAAGATDTDPSLFADTVDALMSDPQVGLVLLVGLFGGYHLRFDPRLRDSENRTAGRLLELAGAHGIPLVVQSCYAADRPYNHAMLRDGGVRVLSSIDHAVRVVAALYRRGRRLHTADQRSTLALHHVPTRPTGRGQVLDEPAARRLVERGGIDVGPWRLVGSAGQAAAAVAGYGRQCALKVVSPQVVHKSDVGGVRLCVTADRAADEYRALVEEVSANVPAADITGVLVTPMAGTGTELLVGATVDPIYGPVVAFGGGGTLVEAVRDVTFRAAPLTHLEAREMLDETTVSRLLDGHRDVAAVNRDRLVELLVRVGDLVATTPGLRELDLNPVIAAGDTLHPVDVRVVVDTAAEGSGS